MKEKIIVTLIAIIVIIGVIFTVMAIEKEEKVQPNQEEKVIISEEVTDECTEEFEISKINNEAQQTNSSEEKISANSAMILKKYYKDCEHTINEYAEIPPELVNLTQEELIKEFPEWELIGFASNEITLFKEVEGNCGEHFSLKELDGRIVIYRILENGEKEIFEETKISTEYLTQTDLIKIQSDKRFRNI